ncbi:hypothetical protein [Acaricomes phytoseiuli]|uniref:hypothetical protein n=1 Tax=Acaricomes phytoseiuli TaxID=291968 RepID=UPI000360D72A|nr:hypothetical protein [Acaricomes phytoseiuli]
MAFWGIVGDVRHGLYNVFLNGAGCSVMLLPAQAEDLSDALGVPLEELSGCHVIAEGRLGDRLGDRLVRIDDISKLQALRPRIQKQVG